MSSEKVKSSWSISAGAAAVFCLSVSLLSYGLSQHGIVEPYNDPVAHIRAQDEAPIVSAAIRMVRDSDWMTPKILGRPFILKPPMLNWLIAVSLRLWGWSLFAVRFPVIILGAAGVWAVFIWVARGRSIPAAILASGILILSPFWQMFSRACLTDVLASSFTAIALAGIVFDFSLSRRRTVLIFSAGTAASILSKSAAGLVPIIVLVTCWMISAREHGCAT